ncbi:MAG TPA: hypothetical protein VMG59_08870 [Phycisphaerae bacterium]|nr:hypothetical protein [Phycisphaerae bacterium]
MTQEHLNLEYLAKFIARRRQHWGIRLVFSGIVALLVALILPLMIITLLICCSAYFLIFVAVLFKFSVAEHIIIILSGILVLIYLILLAISFRNEWELRWVFFSNSEHRPPKDWLTGTVHGPLFYTSLGIDLLDDDVPPPLLLRFVSFPAVLMVKFLIQWKIFRSLKRVDSGRCAPLLQKAISAGGSSKIKDLHESGQPVSTLHDPVSYLLVLDILSVNELWTSVWLSATYREKLMPHAPYFSDKVKG